MKCCPAILVPESIDKYTATKHLSCHDNPPHVSVLNTEGTNTDQIGCNAT